MNPRTILVAVTAFLASCALPGAGERATLAHFERHRAEFEALASAAGSGAAADSIARAFASLAPAARSERGQPSGLGLEVLDHPRHVQVTPVDFYLVLVWVGDPAQLARTDAMRDEGSMRRTLGGGWHLVRRGFM